MKSDKNKHVNQHENDVTNDSGVDERSDGVESRNLLEELEENINNVKSANNRLAALYHKLANEASEHKVREFFLGLEQNVLRDQKEIQDVITGNIKCPNCGSFNRLPILYGLPGPGVPKDVVLGGCIITDNDPKWHCEDCGHEWGRPLGDNE